MNKNNIKGKNITMVWKMMNQNHFIEDNSRALDHEGLREKCYLKVNLIQYTCRSGFKQD